MHGSTSASDGGFGEAPLSHLRGELCPPLSEQNVLRTGVHLSVPATLAGWPCLSSPRRLLDPTFQKTKVVCLQFCSCHGLDLT